MNRETVEQCPLCKSVVRAIECANGHKIFAPVVDGQLSLEESRQRILKMIGDAKFCAQRLGLTVSMLQQVQMFLEQKGHKLMALQVRGLLQSVRDKRSE